MLAAVSGADPVGNISMFVFYWVAIPTARQDERQAPRLPQDGKGPVLLAAKKTWTGDMGLLSPFSSTGSHPVQGAHARTSNKERAHGRRAETVVSEFSMLEKQHRWE